VITHFKVTWDSVIVCNAPSCDTRCTVLELEMVDEVKTLCFQLGRFEESVRHFSEAKFN
jgi:hypothetical protein